MDLMIVLEVFPDFRLDFFHGAAMDISAVFPIHQKQNSAGGKFLQMLIQLLFA